VTELVEADDEAAAVARLHALGCTDGLPVVVPTPDRVAAMLAGAPELDPAIVLGVVPPRMGRATVESVAANAVMAGFPPAHFAAVCAVVRAVCDPDFDLGVVQATTHNAAVLVIVNGPARLVEPAFASGVGALGPGPVANTTTGRALRLVLVNAGGGTPGAGDMSTLGQPAKLSCCLAEAEEESPFEPLSVARGVDAGRSAVTVLGVEGPRQVMFVAVGDGAALDAERLLALLGATVAAPGSLGGMGYGGSSALVLSPYHAGLLAAAGLDRASVAAAVAQRAVLPAHEVERLHGRVRAAGHDTRAGVVRALSSPAHLLVAVAGGAGTYSAVFCGLADGVAPAVTVAF